MDHGFTRETELQERELLTQLNKRCDQEAIYWNQKARVKWLKEGEKNTSFFHKSTIQHRMQNSFSKLRSETGETLEEQEKISEELTRNFTHLLFETNHSHHDAIQKLIQHIPPLVNNEQNQSLTKPITMKEVEATVKKMTEGTSQGPNGFTIEFFHHCYNMLKEEVLDLVEESHQKQWILTALNAMHLELILK